MSLRLETCGKCARVYMLEQFSPAFADDEPPGIIRCPYCSDERLGDPGFIYVGRRLPTHDSA